jgi:hypothetical protein
MLRSRLEDRPVARNGPKAARSESMLTNFRTCRDDDVPLVAIERTEVDDRRAAQQAHRANVRASMLGDPAGGLR